ncbi:MAG: hypothetical protein K6E11_03870 [Bacilli bacterium]|nr:hypothetical protein [Bacilli bacterium]
MKKLIFALPLFTLALTGCDLSGLNDGDDNNESKETTSLPMTPEEGVEKIKEHAEEGLEVAWKVVDDDESVETFSFGIKGNASWHFVDNGDGMVVLGEGATYVDVYDSYVSNEFKYYTTVSEDAQAYFDAHVNAYSAALYYANQLTVGDLYYAGTSTIAGRSALHYTLTVGYAMESASFDLHIDKELGITLKYAIVVNGVESGSASFEVTSVKTGAQVSVPAHEPNPNL